MGDKMSETMTGAEMVVRAMQEQGVEFVFGYPGGSVLPLYDALFHQDSVKHILVRHEQAAVHAAEVRRLHRAGISKSEIARRVQIGRTSVRRILGARL